MIRIQIPEKANHIISVLTEAGFEAYVVGGCVRDAILGRAAADWDITTNARPEQVKALFPRTLDTGLQHGTVTVMQGREGFEVTTYRIDGEYLDGRHPEKVTFTPSLLEDLKRRDFTVNAMALDVRGRLVDLHGGREDLKYRLLRCVGEPERRFREDALRMLRALSGRTHKVHTGLCVCRDGRMAATVETTLVHFASIPETELQAYADTEEGYPSAVAQQTASE